jgi:hypothetical protein
VNHTRHTVEVRHQAVTEFIVSPRFITGSIFDKTKDEKPTTVVIIAKKDGISFDKLCKMNKSYYFDQNNIEEFKQFEIQLNDFINAGATFFNEQIIETKKFVAKYNGIKIEIYSNEALFSPETI